MDLRYLKLVKTIVEEGNITKSADRLFLTKSALSHQLREFEERIGIKVFIRSRNDWQLTKGGQEIYDLACQVIERIDEGLAKITQIKAGSQGTIKLGTECYSFYHGLPAFIQKMGVLYPEIDIILQVESKPPPFSQLLSNELDMCIVTHDSVSDKILTYELFDDELFALVNVENDLADKDYLDPADFAEQHLIIHSYPLETVSVYQHFLKPHHVDPKRITAVPMTEVALELIDSNMGIACYSKWALKLFKLPETLKFVRLGKQGLRRKHFLAIRAEDQDKQYIRDFIDNIKEDDMRAALIS
ncbi:MAG TPA: LysR family transcriptional regulator [Cytophagales bacterium]|nr:LysR family transcriptional regulator [Cytophagales bacterium]HAA20648.1 LysR family transcriptional regulator [Cytophagales bacterium]HAP59381.1 LysR family transcriptional regulator [Cytophagales bacterium]